MSVRFKFRSSVNFDSVDIDSRSSISVRDLKSKIVEHKNLKICQDFDLVISDADTGEEYANEDFLVLSGSSVIIKRVPAGAGGRSAPSVLTQIDLSKNLGKSKQNDFIEASKSSRMNVDVENFDDFGIDLYPAPETSLLDSDTDADDKVNCTTNGKDQNAVPRCSETPIGQPQNLESSDLSQGITRACGFEGDVLESSLNPKLEEHKKFDGLVNASFPAMPKADLPSELRCSLCNTIFKEAVMITCCQHSFCEKCIRLVLVEKGRCPKCSSTKCKVEDLLPNLSLRQAIEHFLESQMLMSGSDNILPNNAPDGESGIQAKEFSCAMSIHQRDPVTPHSPSATGKGSNQVMTDSAYDSMFRSNGPAAGSSSRIIHLDAGKRSATSSQKINHMRNGEGDAFAFPANFTSGPEGLRSGTECEGEDQSSNFDPGFMQEEVKKKKGQWVNHSDGGGSFAATNKYRKGDRTCFMCGSPDHLIRDCPAASNHYPMLPTGDAVFQGGMPAYGPPYWHGASLPHMRPFTNVYANPGMMPFDPSMIAVNPYAVPSYMPSMYGGMPVPYGVMRMGSMAPQMPMGAEHPLARGEFMKFQGSDQRSRFLNDHLERGKAHDGGNSNEGYQYNEPQRSYDYEPHLDKEIIDSYSEDSDIRRSQKKHPHGQRPNHEARFVGQIPEKGSHSGARREHRAHRFDGSSSEIQDASDNSDRPSKDGRHKDHHHRTSKKQSERRAGYASDSSRRNHHQGQKETTIERKRVDADSKRHSGRHHGHTDSGVEPSPSGDRKRQQREKESTHNSRHIRPKGKSTDDHLHHERWEMVDGSDEDRRLEYHHHHHHKRRRNH